MSGILRVWTGDFGLPSFDPDCLQIMAYAKINKCKVKTEYGRLPYWRKIPSFVDAAGHSYSNVGTILNALREIVKFEDPCHWES